MNVVDEEPFGELWEKEMNNWTKKDLILFLKNNLIDLQDAKQKLQQHSFMQAEADVSEAAAVASGAVAKGVSVDENCPKCGCILISTDKFISCAHGCDYVKAL